MITRKAVVRELVRRTCADGTIAFSALLSFDESAATTIRLTEEEHAILEASMGKRRRLVMTLQIGAPDRLELAVSAEAVA